MPFQPRYQPRGTPRESGSSISLGTIHSVERPDSENAPTDGGKRASSGYRADGANSVTGKRFGPRHHRLVEPARVPAVSGNEGGRRYREDHLGSLRTARGPRPQSGLVRSSYLSTHRRVNPKEVCHGSTHPRCALRGRADPVGALAHLQLGRAFALLGDKTKAKTAYQDFLTLWKDADPDIPILQQAKAEYAELR